MGLKNTYIVICVFRKEPNETNSAHYYIDDFNSYIKENQQLLNKNYDHAE